MTTVTVPATDQSVFDRIGWPVIWGFIATVLTGAITLAFGLDPAASATIEGFIIMAASFAARQKVTPWKPDQMADWSAEQLKAEAETVGPVE